MGMSVDGDTQTNDAGDPGRNDAGSAARNDAGDASANDVGAAGASDAGAHDAAARPSDHGDASPFGPDVLDGSPLNPGPIGYVGFLSSEGGSFLEPQQPIYVVLGYPAPSRAMLSLDGLSLTEAEATVLDEDAYARTWILKPPVFATVRGLSCAEYPPINTVRFDQFRVVQISSGITGVAVGIAHRAAEVNSQDNLTGSIHGSPDSRGPVLTSAPGLVVDPLSGARWYTGRPLKESAPLRFSSGVDVTTVAIDALTGVLRTTTTLEPGAVYTLQSTPLVDATGLAASPAITVTTSGVSGHISDGGFETLNIEGTGFATDGGPSPITGLKSLYARNGGALLLTIDIPAGAERIRFDYRVLGDGRTERTGYRMRMSATGSSQISAFDLEHSPLYASGTTLQGSLGIPDEWQGRRGLVGFARHGNAPCGGQAHPSFVPFQIDNLRFE